MWNLDCVRNSAKMVFRIVFTARLRLSVQQCEDNPVSYFLCLNNIFHFLVLPRFYFFAEPDPADIFGGRL